jgi:hypothetical protein
MMPLATESSGGGVNSPFAMQFRSSHSPQGIKTCQVLHSSPIEYHRLMRVSYLAAFLSLANLALAQPLAKNATQLQGEVEDGLLRSVQIQGRPFIKSSIADRMKAMHIRGVSVAVIHN